MTLPVEAVVCDCRGVVVRSTALADALAGAPLVGRSLVEIAGAVDAARVAVFIAWSARSSEARPARLVVRGRGGRDAELTGRRAGLDADAIAFVVAECKPAPASSERTVAIRVDELTGLPNYRAFREHLVDVPADTTLAVIDVDDMRRFNDRLGHIVGDEVLRAIARVLRDAADRWEGRAFRQVGNQFALTVRRGVDETVAILEAVRDAIGGEATPRSATRTTVGVGVASCARGGQTAFDVADAELLRAKQSGPDTVCVGSIAPDDLLIDELTRAGTPLALHRALARPAVTDEGRACGVLLAVVDDPDPTALLAAADLLRDIARRVHADIYRTGADELTCLVRGDGQEQAELLGDVLRDALAIADLRSATSGARLGVASGSTSFMWGEDGAGEAAIERARRACRHGGSSGGEP